MGASAMIKIAILGCDSTHTEAYTTLINEVEGPFYNKAKVCWIWGEDHHQALEKAAILKIETVLDSPDSEILKSADLIMVVGRFGDSHFKPAISAIKSGRPVFVDKPFTNSDQEAVQLIQLAEERNVPLVSFSPLRFADEIVSLRDQYPDNSKIQTVIATSPMITRTIHDERVNSVYFYSVHAIDMLLSLVKKRPVSVNAHRHSNGVWVDILFDDQSISALNLTIDQPETYQVTLFDLDGRIITVNMDPDGPYYRNTLAFLFKNLENLKSDSAPLIQSLDSIRVLTAVEKSLTNHKQTLLYG
jgi:predicted dehydrogenase